MAGKAGFRIQDSGFRNDGLAGGQMGRRAVRRISNLKFEISVSCLPAYLAICLFVLLCASLVTLHSSLLFAQQPQAQGGQPLSALNVKYVNGVAPGYWPTAGSGLTLNLTQGTAMCGYPPAPVTYAGGTLTMTAAATNYVYLDPMGSCAPAVNTSGFGVGQIPIAVVVTSASGITSVNDVRSWFAPPQSMDSTGRSILKGLNGGYFADQFGNKSSTGIANAISACGTSTPCRVMVPGTYPTTEAVPGGYLGVMAPATTSSNVQVFDYRYGDYQTAVNPQGYGANHRPWHQWIDNQYIAPSGPLSSHNLLTLTMNAADGGTLYQNNAVGAYAKNLYSAIEAYTNKYTPSSDGVVESTCNNYSPGDCVPLYGSDNFYGGQNTQGEEGSEVADFWLMQGTQDYQGTISSGGSTGSTSLTMSSAAGEGTQGAGRYLIDTTSGKTITAGTISAISTNGGGTPITFTGSGTSWPVSTVNTTITQAITAPGSQTVTVGSTTGITANSTVLIVCDGTEQEFIIPTAVGSGTITANFKYPRATGATLAAGGLTGYFLELTADTVSSSTTGGTTVRQVFPVLYSTSSTSLAAAIIQQGSYAAFVPSDATAWANSGGSNGYVLYPGTTVNSVQTNGIVSDTFTLMPNNVAWASGDSVELPHHPAAYARIGSWLVQRWQPFSGASGPTLQFNGIHGYYTTGFYMRNASPLTIYSGNGGNLAPPQYGFEMLGPWANGLYMNSIFPGATGLYMGAPAWGTSTTVYPIMAWNANNSNDVLSYNQSTASWTLTANSRGANYNFGPTSFSVPSGVAVGSQPYDAGGFFPGLPNSGQLMWSVYFTRTVTFPSGLGTVLGGASGCLAGVGATASAVVSLSRIPSGSTTATPFGTCTFAANAGAADEAGTITSSAAVTFSAGDVLTVTAPATADATLANITVTLAGTRQ
jgi:hypothetical protein